MGAGAITAGPTGGRTLIATAQQGESLDALCWRILGATAGVVEAALALNPRHVAHRLLPEGTPIILPADRKDARTNGGTPRETLNLWS